MERVGKEEDEERNQNSGEKNHLHTAVSTTQLGCTGPEPNMTEFKSSSSQLGRFDRVLKHRSNVYSFGVLLELLTEKTPFRDLIQEHGNGIARWVRSVGEDET